MYTQAAENVCSDEFVWEDSFFIDAFAQEVRKFTNNHTEMKRRNTSVVLQVLDTYELHSSEFDKS